MAKDINRFSFSRFKTFHQCPRKHYYQYIEQVETPENMTAMPGKLFHEAVALITEGQDPTPIYKQFESYCKSGQLEMESDLLENVVGYYFSYYKYDFVMERTLMIEEVIEESLDGDDKMIVVIDHVFERRDTGLIFLRDRKTSLGALKYKLEDVVGNQQLLLYVPYAEDKIQMKIDAVQIDEIRLQKLDPVPVNNNGKPSTDKRRLANVTYEAYYDYLAGMGLEDEKSYQDTLEWMRERGHPLFNRVTHQLLDLNEIDTNMEDMHNTYDVIKSNTVKYRVRGPLCNWCPFKDLCALDMINPTDQDRDVMKIKIKSAK